jgi:hypothetical protein
MTKISRDQLRRIIRETKASVDAETSKRTSLTETTRKEINALNEAKKAVALHEARLKKQLNDYTELSATISTVNEISEILENKINELGFLKNLGRVAKQTVGDWPGFGVRAGGETSKDLESQKLNTKLKAVKSAEKAAKSVKISDTEMFGDALMKYINSLADLYEDFKFLDKSSSDRANPMSKGDEDMIKAIADEFFNARFFLREITLKVSAALTAITNTLRNSPILQMSQPTGRG